ncbi:MAG: hypothetical protein H8E54_00590 [Candidatus Aminicenantes bacterium]|nr:hypothetical protein [Candidatus Aminicenantes bacterium]
MFPIETSKAQLRRIDYDILEFLEYPKTLEEIRSVFPNVNVTVKILQFLDKRLIEEKKEKYISKFHTQAIKTIIDDSNVPDYAKKNFHFFLSQIDNPFVRQSVFDSEAREKSHLVLSLITKSLNQQITQKELITLKLAINDLMDKLR